VVNLAEAHRKTGSNYISIWEDFADTLAIPAMVYLLKYHLRFDTIICAASPAYSTDPALSDLFPLRISTRRGYWRGSAANADHLGFKYGLPPTFVGFILSA
jgi:hypothetical protein